MQQILHDLLTSHLTNLGYDDFSILITNKSHLHASHFTGNGQSHFEITISSAQLSQLSTVQGHKILNQAVFKLLKTEEVHSISFKITQPATI